MTKSAHVHTHQVLELSGGLDHDFGTSGPTATTDSFHRTNNVHSFDHRTKNNMLAVQPGGFRRAQEELGSVSVRTSVSHGKGSSAGVLQLEIFVGKFGACRRAFQFSKTNNRIEGPEYNKEFLP
jgi:hypothetical protein